MPTDMVNQIEAYFDDPSSSKCRDLASIGGDIIPVGLVVITRKLRQLALNTIYMSITNPDAPLDELIQEVGLRWLDSFVSVLREIGPSSVDRLVALLSHHDPDIQALSAILLFIAPIELEIDGSTFRHSQPKIEYCYQKSKGTGVRLALAALLMNFGNSSAIKSLTFPYLTATEEEFLAQLEYLRIITANADMKRLEYSLLKKLALSRGTPLIVWDIATNGKGPAYLWSSWLRY